MLLRLDDTPVLGVLSIDGYLDIRNRNDEETAALILERCRQQGRPEHEGTPTPTGFKDAGTIRDGRSVICDVGLQRGERIQVALTAEQELDFPLFARPRSTRNGGTTPN